MHATAAAAVQRHATVKSDRIIAAWYLHVYPVSCSIWRLLFYAIAIRVCKKIKLDQVSRVFNDSIFSKVVYKDRVILVTN